MGHGVIPLQRPRPTWGRASLTLSSRRPTRPGVSSPALPVRTAAVPWPTSTGGPVAGRRTQLRHQRAMRSWLAPCLVSAVHRRASRTPATACVAARRNGTQGRHAQGRRRFAPPAAGLSRAGLPSLTRYRNHRDPCTRQQSGNALGWTPSRPPAGDAWLERLVSSGRSLS